MSILSFKRNRAPYGSLIKQKSLLWDHGVMHQWGMNYWDACSPVVNSVSVRSMLTLSILIDIHTKSVYFVLAYTQSDMKICGNVILLSPW